MQKYTRIKQGMASLVTTLIYSFTEGKTYSIERGFTLKMKTFKAFIDGITEILNHKGRSKKGFNSREEILFLLKGLKQNYNTELSLKFLFNLLDKNLIQKKRKQKIRNLIKTLEIYKSWKASRKLDLLKYKTNVVEYGLNKWNKPVIKKIRLQQIGKEYINSNRKVLSYIKLGLPDTYHTLTKEEILSYPETA